MTHALGFSIQSLSTFLALIMLLSIAPQVLAQQMVSVSSREVNMRTGPGTQHPASWIVGRGYPLKVIGRQGNWLQVSDFENDRGWVYRPLTGGTPNHIVKVSVANLRSQPTTNGRILGKLSYGDVVRTLERRDSWVKVQRESGLRGWVARRLLWGW